VAAAISRQFISQDGYIGGFNLRLAAQPAIPTRPAKSTSSIPDEKVPLADVPSTGDVASVWYALTLAAAASLAALKLTGKRKEQ